MPDDQPLTPGFHAVSPGHIAAIVTHLDMTEAPDTEVRRAPQGVTLERWIRPDLDAYRRLFRSVGETWLWFSRLALDDAALTDVLHDQRAEVYTVQRGGHAVGLLELDFRAAPVAELAFFGLVPEAAGQGIGRWLMAEALAKAWDPSRRPQTRVLTVHTCTLDSPAALPFYLRSGFRAVRREVEIAPDPRCTGWLGKDAAPKTPVID